MKPKVDWKIVITAIVCVTGLEAYALHCGIDGGMLALALAAIAGLAGYQLKKPS